MRTALLLLPLLLAACSQESPSTPSPAETSEVDQTATPTAAATTPTRPASTGTAQITLEGEGVSISGAYPAKLCGTAYVMGEGFAYQTQADGWQITIASEDRTAGDVPLNASDDQVNVAVTVNGPNNSHFVRGPRNGGSLRISDDFRHAEADLELRPLLTRGTARLTATFTCE